MGSGSVSPVPEELAAGQILAGKYMLVRQLGIGGMCIVFEAEHVHLKQGVALKILKPELAQDADSVARFSREAQAAAKLRSSNVARVYDVDVLPDGQPYITMELLVGHDLGTELQRHGNVETSLAVDYVRQACSGITEAHALGIIHRDLKPENLFLTELGVHTDRKLVKILDFGIAKNLSESQRRLTAPDAVFGTVDYMSPEQIRSASTVDSRTDIWSLGVILYELITGRLPYAGDARSVIAQIVSDPIPPPSRFLPDLPPSLVAIVMKALAKDPTQRWQSADEFRDALSPFSEHMEPITDVLGRLPPQSMPRRTVDTPFAPTPLADGQPAREMRTNVSWAGAPTPKKSSNRFRWGAALVVILGVGGATGYVKRDLLKERWGAMRAATVTPPEPSPAPSPTAPAVPAVVTAAPAPTETAVTAPVVSVSPTTSASTAPAVAEIPSAKKPPRRPPASAPHHDSTPAPPPSPAPSPTLPKHL